MADPMADAGGDEREVVGAYLPLPDSSAETRDTARLVFDGIAGRYDAARPGYPLALFDDLRARSGLHVGSRVLEVGCGTGQATRSLAEAGYEVRCVELGEQLAVLARNNLAVFPNVTVEVGAFETVEVPPCAFDLVFSATAFHWIDPAVGYPKAARLLDEGGCLALVTNAHVAGGTQDAIAEAVQDLHRRDASDIGPWKFPTVDEVVRRANAGGDIAEVWSRIDRNFGEPPAVDAWFEPPVISTYPWLAHYDRDTYLAMLATQSSYAFIDDRRRDDLLAKLGAIIDTQLDGTITKQYLAILATATSRRGGHDHAPSRT